MKKILIVSALFPPEPVVSSILSFDIALELSKNYNVTVLSPFPSRPNGMLFNKNFSLNNNFTHIYLNSYISKKSTILSRFLESYSFGRKTKQYIINNRNNIDVIYINTWPIIAQYITVKCANVFFIPIVTHIQDIYPEALIQKIPFFKKIIQKILLPIDIAITEKSNKIITISNGMKELLLKTRNLNSNKVEVIYNWQNENNFLNNYSVDKVSKKHFTFMFSGSLNKLANINSLIIAFHKANIKNSKFIIAGDGPEKKSLLKLVSELNAENIIFESFRSTEVAKIQSKSDVLILSLNKGASHLAFPSKIPAYMFSEKPILAFIDIPSNISDIIYKAECGWSIQSGEIDTLINTMREIAICNPTVLEEKGKKGKIFALENLSKNVNLKKVTEIILEQIK